MTRSLDKEQGQSLRRNEEKWTKALMAAGWTVWPTVLLERQQGLGLDAIDVNILLHLARYWWYKDNPPHPSKKAIAECMGIATSTVRKRIAKMEADGLIRRESRFRGDGAQQTNIYHFDGLIESALPFALEAVEEREAKRRGDAARRTRKGRKLRLVSEGGKKIKK